MLLPDDFAGTTEIGVHGREAEVLIRNSLKSVRNIEKITKVCTAAVQRECLADPFQSMKVVASTKLTRAEKAMREAKKYGGASNGMCCDIGQAVGDGSGKQVVGRHRYVLP